MLLDRNGAKPDLWSRNEPLEPGKSPIFNWDIFLQKLPNDRVSQPLGIELQNDFDAQTIKPHFDQLALIAIRFPAFSDGRGFTLAKRLRRSGFTGTLRATGPLIPDQFAYALACGFDEVELPQASAERQTAEQWTAALEARSEVYQRGYTGVQASILDRRRQAREAEGV